MESSLTKACQLKIQNFEGPFDLLFHLLEKNQLNIYDIPINDITDQYMEYLFGMQELDLEIASEFLVMAATLLHIKSKMLLPDKREKPEDAIDPREELVLKLIEYKKYKEFSQVLRQNEKEWEKVFYKLPEVIDFKWDEEILELSPDELKRVYCNLLDKNKRKINKNAGRMTQIIQHEKVSLKSKMREIVRNLFSKAYFVFSEVFSVKEQTPTEVVTGFMAMLELTKLKKIRLQQDKQFSEILIHRNSDIMEDIEDDKLSVEI